ncbi:hypothetical protein AB834_02715 [PVC group bacterium (ex Bugula neritina AB1)]|nr:hypothetical protein AB834_02715 [PVC group bacterium (ex Bugula neritina AB1)]
MPRVEFSKDLQKLRDFLPQLLAILQDSHKGYAFITLDDVFQKSVSSSKSDNVLSQRDRGLVMRILIQGVNFECATNHLDPKSLLEKARTFRAKTLINAEKIEHKGGHDFSYTPKTWKEELSFPLDSLIKDQLNEDLTPEQQVHFGTPFQQDPAETNLNWMTQKAKSLKKELREKVDKSFDTVGVMLRQKIKTKIFIDSQKNMSQSLLTSLAYAYVVSPKGRFSRVVSGGMAGFESATIDSSELSKLSETSLKIENAKYLEAGRYPVITGPDVTGVIAHEAFGHTQEGDTCRYGRSCAPLLKKDKVKVGNDHATIVNNAAVFCMGAYPYGQNGSHFFDDEGQLAREHVILKKGELQTPMNDLLSSLKGDVNGCGPRQSNGKRESWRRPLMARQTNTYFTPGDRSLEELIAMVDYGFLAENAYGGMEDPKGMGLTAGTEYLQEIKDGKLTGEIFLGPCGGHVELSDSVPLLLNGILAKSKMEEDWSSQTPYNKWGGCGKYHKESVEAGSGGPWILWKGINCG